MWQNLVRKTHEIKFEFLSQTDVRHRCSDVPCPKQTAVMVDGRYLHANFVGQGVSKITFVASQCPLTEDFELFWRFAFENKSAIFDLTHSALFDLNHSASPETHYYPHAVGETAVFGSMKVKLLDQTDNIFAYEVTHTPSGQSSTIKRFHYNSWEDASDIPIDILNTLVQLLSSQKNTTLVHCHAGIGRTGTLISAAILREQILERTLTRETLDQILLDTLIRLRAQRGPQFVQDQKQFDLLRNYYLLLLENPLSLTFQPLLVKKYALLLADQTSTEVQ